jgi:hypothetical protein
MNRLEQAVTELLDKLDRQSPSMILTAELDNLRRAMRPEVDWESVPFGTTVRNRNARAPGKFIRHRIGQEVMDVLVAGIIVEWKAEHCTVEPESKYTVLIKHPWPADYKKPSWIYHGDYIIFDDGNNNSDSIDWENPGDWFAVVQS